MNGPLSPPVLEAVYQVYLLRTQRWHVYFDGKPETEGHICGRCRLIGLSLDCLDAGPDGDCAHVQTRLCDCPEPKPECMGGA